MNRTRKIIRVGVVGVAANLVLVGIKVFVGVISGSISIISDAVNNLSDVASSLVTIFGMMLAGKKPDKKHPFGYGKVEHVSALMIALIIAGTGISVLTEAAQKIIRPELAEYNTGMILLLVAGVVIKLALCLYTQNRGRKLKSESLIASGTDAMFDVVIAISTIIGAGITLIFGVTIDGWVGVVISALIIKTGVEIALENFSHIIGAQVESELAENLKKTIGRRKEVLGVYDLILHQYGPEKTIGSVHIEVDEQMTAREIHQLSHEITEEVLEKFGVVLTIGIYASNTEDTEYIKMKRYVAGLVRRNPAISSMHGYYVDGEKKVISFDLVFAAGEKEIDKAVAEIQERVEEKYPEYKVSIVTDIDFSE